MLCYFKILGGDSAVNGLVWVRGAKEEYDAFEDLGSRGWNWNSLYSYMKKVSFEYFIVSLSPF